MKRLIVAFCSMVVLAISVQAIEIKTIWDMPNARGSSYFGINGNGLGAETSFLRYKCVDLAFGAGMFDGKYANTGALEINLNKISIPGVTFLFQDFLKEDTFVGIWLGCNFSEMRYNYGFNISLINFEK